MLIRERRFVWYGSVIFSDTPYLKGYTVEPVLKSQDRWCPTAVVSQERCYCIVVPLLMAALYKGHPL